MTKKGQNSISIARFRLLTFLLSKWVLKHSGESKMVENGFGGCFFLPSNYLINKVGQIVEFYSENYSESPVLAK